MNRFLSLTVMNLVTNKAAAKHEDNFCFKAGGHYGDYCSKLVHFKAQKTFSELNKTLA